MLQPVFLRELQVDATGGLRHAHLGAASGLALCGDWLYVIADDEHHIASLRRDAPAQAPLQLHRIRAGDLPADKHERKRRKPDFEVLAAAAPTHLLALGSGSGPTRGGGLLIEVDSGGGLDGAPREFDLAPLYAPLRREFADLNIEGGFVQGAWLHLLQRANAGAVVNACITYDAREFLAWACEEGKVPAARGVVRHELGGAGAVPFGFTDGTPCGDGWLFSAVAEDTCDSFADGTCVASAIGYVDAAGRLQWLEPLAGAPKVEGIALAGAGRLLMVTDADEPGRASQLLAVDLPR